MFLIHKVLLLVLLTSIVSALIEPILLVHGGAGNIPEGGIPGKLSGIKTAIERGYKLLIDNKSSLDAVEEAVRSMEDDDHFNAGYGSVLNADGEVEMDAAISSGFDLNAGCLTLVKDIAHPISLARLLMENSQYVFLAGNGTRNFAIEQGVEILPPGALVSNKSRAALQNYKKSAALHNTSLFSRSEVDVLGQTTGEHERGTVGAVAIDIFGNISAATSTGGIMNKPSGRVGDTPVLGSGTFADNLVGGVSATGDGEYLLRINLAQQILQRIRYENMSAQEATAAALMEMERRVGGKGGAITIDRHSNVGIFFVSKQMAWGYRQGNVIRYGANKNQTIEENVKHDVETTQPFN